MIKYLLPVFLLGCSSFLNGQVTSISDKTNGLERQEGYFNYYYDSESGKIWLEIPQLGVDVLYVNSLTAGLGSNDIGLDRNQLGDTRIVRFIREGKKVLLLQPNLKYRANTENELEKKAVEEA
ncbi:MAG: DUF5118 domain-containing protein, partial [Phaeodactylibacter sp.]|nr:DUF5118 domain-containing protein [Phaeodactylibacter sp.]